MLMKCKFIMYSCTICKFNSEALLLWYGISAKLLSFCCRKLTREMSGDMTEDKKVSLFNEDV